MLARWNALPAEMQNDIVKEYYDILSKKKLTLFLKRAFDLILSAFMLILISPVLLVIALLVRVDSKGPVFYRQERITTGNKTFRIYKFRTMVVNADKIGSLITVDGDPRITRVGSKLRKCKLDELPQLFNVLSGDMSFVGTRPEVKKYVDRYSDEMYATLLLPAGVTSFASVTFKDEERIMGEHIASGETVDAIYLKYVLPEKMKHNLKYLKELSVAGDIKMMFTTAFSVLKRG